MKTNFTNFIENALAYANLNGTPTSDIVDNMMCIFGLTQEQEDLFYKLKGKYEDKLNVTYGESFSAEILKLVKEEVNKYIVL